jgi:hypothetical protein
MNIPRLAIVMGALLIVVSVVSVALTSPTFTAFLPAIAGAIMLVLGLVAQQRASLTRHMMHAALLVALLVLVGSLRVFTVLGDPTASTVAVGAQFATIIITAVFIAFGVKSFIDARKARQSSAR